MNFNDIEWKELYGSIGAGSRGVLGVRIMVGGTNLPDMEGRGTAKEIMYAAMDAEKTVRAQIVKAQIAVDPKAQERTKADRKNILACFPAPIYVEEIPNGYCNDTCCSHLPWFVVTTVVGRFKIGWRKSVMNLDWSETLCTKTGEELFPGENVTKGDCYIHAYSYQLATQYILAIIAAAQNKEQQPAVTDTHE